MTISVTEYGSSGKKFRVMVYKTVGRMGRVAGGIMDKDKVESFIARYKRLWKD